MSKAISKITVRCPHCQAQQQEPAMAKSTYCRRCSEYFAISASTRADVEFASSEHSPAKGASSWARASAPVPLAEPKSNPAIAEAKYSVPSPATPASAEGLRGKLEGLFASKPKTQIAHCFECSAWAEVSTTARSSTCKACGAYIDLQDYKVTGSFSRNIKTRGTVYLSTKGDLSSSKIFCSHATIHGKMRGNLVCPGKVTIRMQGKIFGSVESGELIVERGSDVSFARPIHTATAEVHGRMSGEILAHGHVTIHKSGVLDGSVAATGFSVEKGGCFQGELTICPRQAVADAPVPDAPDAVPEVETVHPDLLAGGERSMAAG